MNNTITIGSLISAKYGSVHTISLVSRVEGRELYCDHSICSVDGKVFRPTKNIYSAYEGEVLEPWVTLASVEEFDIVVDTQIIPSDKLVNV